MGPDDRADFADQAFMTGRDTGQRSRKFDKSGASALIIGQTFEGTGGACFVRQVLERLGPGPLSRLLLDHTVPYLDDRFDGEECTQSRRRTTDTASLAQILERVDGTKTESLSLAEVAAPTTSSIDPPRPAASAAAKTTSPSPIVALNESTISTRSHLPTPAPLDRPPRW